MKNLSKFVFALFTLFLFSNLFLITKLSFAQDNLSDYFSCRSVDDPEFHSLRPYPADDSCTNETSSFAKFCGNTLTLQETINKNYVPNDPNCVIDGNKATCTYKEKISHNVTIDLSGAELPIMGNTEDVINSQSSEETIDDITKVNEYVSWYLNGVTNKAEYGDTKNNDYETVNLSGPLKKLLPSVIQEAQKIEIIEKSIEPNILKSPEIHNQIVVCGKEKGIPIIGDVLNIGKTTPVECYKGDGSKAEGDIYRLSDWGGRLSILNDLSNLVGQVFNILPSITEINIYDSLFHHWNKRTPPLPWADKNGQPFKNDLLYKKAYNEWQGKTCVIVPIINALFCLDNILIPNKYADLFSFVPLSSHEDLEGNIKITDEQYDRDNISDLKFSNQSPATLYFSHIQESDELGSLLQDTYISNDKSLSKVGPDTAVDPSSCQTVDVRSNSGDNLFAGEISGILEYTASFTCEFDLSGCGNISSRVAPLCNDELLGECVPADWMCNLDMNRQDCPIGYTCGQGCFCNKTIPPCTKTFSISLSTESSTPKIDDVWSRLVGGPTSIVKRMFPKLGSQIGTLKDLPGSTDINYSGSGVNSSASLNLPHVGGISEYFLKGIQTLLRPKGYGEPISFGPTTSDGQNSCKDGEIPELPSAAGSCKFNNLGSIVQTNLSNLPTLVKIIEAASQSYNVPPGLILGIIFGEGSFNPGRYDWTEENVKDWSCTSMPSCSSTTFPSTGVVPFFEPYWNKIKDAVNVVDPTREPNPCNLMDAIFALAKDLNQSQSGSSAFSGKTCYGISLNSGGGASGSCSWDNSDYETAIRVWEFGTAYTSSVTCNTLPGSCATGGGLTGACPGGDVCEKIGNPGNTSHNACVWNVARGH